MPQHRNQVRRSKAERQRIIVEIERRRREEGCSVRSLLREMGVASKTYYHWTREKEPGGFVPVTLVPPSEPRTLAVVSPKGFRIEGLTLADAATLLAKLG
ncbi:hypothetical protein D3C87_1714400 [compost metagenome]